MRILLMLAAAAAVTACSAGKAPDQSQSTSQTVELSSASDPTESRAKASNAPAPLAVSVPQLAYAYKLGYLLPNAEIAPVQEAHRALCERMGPARCQLLALSRGQAQDAMGAAMLKLRVASADVRRFSEDAAKVVGAAGGRAVETEVAAEDVSKDLVDAEARIRQRELLVARLTEILRTRTGKVAELVEAERSVADAQEELDKAKAWLAELRARVAMSDVEIRYRATAPSASAGSAGVQLIDAVTGSGASFLIGLRLLLTLLIYLLPWGLLAVPVALAVRALLRRRRPNGAVAAVANKDDSPQA